MDRYDPSDPRVRMKEWMAFGIAQQVCVILLLIALFTVCSIRLGDDPTLKAIIQYTCAVGIGIQAGMLYCRVRKAMSE